MPKDKSKTPRNDCLFVLHQLDLKGGRSKLSEFSDGIFENIKRKYTQIEVQDRINEWHLSTIESCRIKGWINCYYWSGENKIEPCAVSNNNFDPKYIDITFSGKEELQNLRKKPSIPPINHLLGDDKSMSTTPNRSDASVDRKSSRPRKELRALIEDERNRISKLTIEKIAKHIAGRQGQAGFRSELLDKFQNQCCITECKIQDILEAAHINPFHKSLNHEWWNGLILRCDIHTLFDLHLLTIRMTSICAGEVLLHASLRPKLILPQEEVFKHYKGLHHVIVELPDLGSTDENEKRREAINKHKDSCFEINSKLEFETDCVIM